jgi:hypothetical protein
MPLCTLCTLWLESIVPTIVYPVYIVVNNTTSLHQAAGGITKRPLCSLCSLWLALHRIDTRPPEAEQKTDNDYFIAL